MSLSLFTFKTGSESSFLMKRKSNSISVGEVYRDLALQRCSPNAQRHSNSLVSCLAPTLNVWSWHSLDHWTLAKLDAIGRELPDTQMNTHEDIVCIETNFPTLQLLCSSCLLFQDAAWALKRVDADAPFRAGHFITASPVLCWVWLVTTCCKKKLSRCSAGKGTRCTLLLTAIPGSRSKVGGDSHPQTASSDLHPTCITRN